MARFAVLLTPTNLDYIPSPTQLERTRTSLQDFFEYRENDATAGIYPDYKFVTTGDQFEKLGCPLCGAEIDRFDEENEDWWYEFESQLGASQYPAKETVAMPCCGEEVTARQIDFAGEALFTKCLIRLLEPGDEPQLDALQLKALEAALGTELTQLVEVNS